MRATLLFSAIALLVSVSSAAILKVASDGTQPYAQILDAITASASGDTILVMGGGYTGFTVPHRLIIIGAGTGVGVGEGVLVNGFVAVAEAADSTELRSLWIKGSFANGTGDSLSGPLRIHSSAERVFIWRCFVENLNANNSTSQLWVGNGTSTDVVQSIFWASGDTDVSGHKAILQRGSSTLTIISCVVVGCDYVISRYATNPGASVTVTHSLFTGSSGTIYGCQTEGAGVIENCAYLVNAGTISYSGGAGVTYSYCASNGALPPGATHIACATTDFVNFYSTDARAADYHLAEVSVLRDAGSPGSPDDLDGSRADIGIYGGQNPYVDGGVPDYPFAVQVKVPYSAPLNGTMRIWGRGRVGPGN